jgi:sterol desaturase/sphingolipid hydroxylase (fatty acid hydroxylase superfamily)
MSFGQLVVAYLTHPAIWAYAALAVAGTGFALHLGRESGPALLLELGLPFAAAVLMYPFAEYLLHRFVLHSRMLYRSPRTVALWKRIHYDHHADPHDLGVLFGALHTTLPTIALVTLPTGMAISGPAGAAAAFAAGVGCMLVYEFVHCVGHLAYTPRSAVLQRLKRQHLLHHFHNEHGNFGITSTVVDRLVGSYYDQPGARPRSETVFNLGYGEAERRRYPWLAQRSGLPDRARRAPASH